MVYVVALATFDLGDGGRCAFSHRLITCHTKLTEGPLYCLTTGAIGPSPRLSFHEVSRKMVMATGRGQVCKRLAFVVVFVSVSLLEAA